MLSEIEKEIIKAMCKYDMNISNVSISMIYHRNSIIYHIGKIIKKTGLDPRKFYDLLKLKEMCEEK